MLPYNAARDTETSGLGETEKGKMLAKMIICFQIKENRFFESECQSFQLLQSRAAQALSAVRTQEQSS